MVFLDIKQPKGGAAITSFPSFFALLGETSYLMSLIYELGVKYA